MTETDRQQPSFPRSTHELSRLTWPEVEAARARSPSLVLPLGGCEPYADLGALGVASACVEALAHALSNKLGILVGPTLAIGCSTPLAAFGGTACVKPRTLTNIVCESARMWFLQGFKSIFIIDGLADNFEAIGLALRRLKHSNPERAVVAFSLQRDERVRAFIGNHEPGKELGRTEYGMLSLAAYVNPGLVRKSGEAGSEVQPEAAERYRTWRKRGADPQQFRKYFSKASSSAIASRYDADFGRELFGFILQLLIDDVTPILLPLPL